MDLTPPQRTPRQLHTRTEQQTSVNCFHVFFFQVAFSGEIIGILQSRSSAHQMDRTQAPLFAFELRPLIDILGSRPWGP